MLTSKKKKKQKQKKERGVLFTLFPTLWPKLQAPQIQSDRENTAHARPALLSRCQKLGLDTEGKTRSLLRKYFQCRGKR